MSQRMSNKKSTQKRPLTNQEALFMNQFMKSAMIPKPIQGIRQRIAQKNPNRTLPLRGPLDRPPVQVRSKKSSTGSSYNDGFDCISPPDVRDQRTEDFDELIGAITVANQPNFNVVQYSINPGSATMFPRFSKIAQLYERYRFTKLEFYNLHEVSQYNTAGQAGLVILSALYDASSSAPTLKTQMEATKPRVICMANQSSLLKCGPNRLHPQGVPLYVRPGGLPGGADVKTYDAGNLFVATQGITQNVEVGELHVRGTCILMDEILDASALQAPSNNQVSWFQSTTTEAATTNVTQTMLLATASTNGLSIVNTAGSMVPPAGNYIVDFWACVSNATLADTVDLILDFKKNATSIILSTIKPGNNAAVAAGAGGVVTAQANGAVYVTANGTDAFTLVAIPNAAGGVLTVAGSARWTAV